MNAIFSHSTGTQPRLLVRTAWQRTQIYSQIFAAELHPTQWLRWPLSAHFLPQKQLKLMLMAADQSSLADGQIARANWRRIMQLVHTISWIPWLDSIWITGSVAAGAATEQDDIDVCLVTDPQRLWLTRLLVILVALVCGRYRGAASNDAQARHQWCFNLWLESDHLHLPAARQTVYTARELVQARLVYARWDARPHHWLTNNFWVRRFTKRGWWWSWQMISALSRAPWSAVKSLVRWPLLSGGWSMLNYLAWWWQRRYMHGRKTREEVTFHTAFFHPRDTQNWVVAEYEKQTQLAGVVPYDFPHTIQYRP